MLVSQSIKTSLLLIFACSVAHAASIKDDISIERVVGKAIAAEALNISDDGNKIVYIAKAETDIQQAPPTTAWMVTKKDGVWQEPEKLPISGYVTSVTFAHNDEWIVASTSHGTAKGYLKILKLALSGDTDKIGDLMGFEHRIEIRDALKPKKKIFNFKPADFSLAKPEMLKHARVSPDGKLMTFYTHGIEAQRGIYLYNFDTQKTIHFGAFDDKHPTWTADGKKILFHSQVGGNAFSSAVEAASADATEALETSVLGYYDLSLRADGEMQANRILMDVNKKGFSYQKHPANYPGTDLIFFHGADAPDKAKKIYVRRLGVGTEVYKLSDLKLDGVEIQNGKHPNSSINASGLYFVGRLEGAPKSETRTLDRYSENPRMIDVDDLKDIFHLSHEDVMRISAQVK